MHTEYTTQGTCSKAILIDMDDDTHVIQEVHVIGGCPGNTVGLAALAQGRTAEEVIARLKGILCRDKGTSCPDQLARALDQGLRQLKSSTL